MRGDSFALALMPAGEPASHRQVACTQQNASKQQQHMATHRYNKRSDSATSTRGGVAPVSPAPAAPPATDPLARDEDDGPNLVVYKKVRLCLTVCLHECMSVSHSVFTRRYSSLYHAASGSTSMQKIHRLLYPYYHPILAIHEYV